MRTVEFHDISSVEDSFLKYAVIVSCHNGKWIYCKHKERDSWEIPGGRREPGEPILDTAKRELFEESGASDYEITPVSAYCVTDDPNSYGLLCYATVHTIGQLPASEIEYIQLFDDEPEVLTYPHMHPILFSKVKSWIAEF